MKMTIAFVLGIAATACGTDEAQDWVKDFNPPPLQDGYQRYVTPIIRGIQPGEDVEWCQWIATPTEKSADLIDIAGWQSNTGHHALLYTSTLTNYAVGESHICTEEDMVSFSFLGGVGGEGVSGSFARLPDGLFFRLPEGRALVANTHWLNATDEVVDGQAVLDVKLDAAKPERMIADLFANNGDTFHIPAGTVGTHDVTCTVAKPVNLAMITNHLHEHGSAIYTELIHEDGDIEMLRNDPQWKVEWQFDPQYTRYSVAQPKILKAGDKLHTHCEWNNTTSGTLTFPDEMCVGAGFYFPGNGIMTCENGTWLGGT
jgi:hypothetical protein